MVSRRGIPFAVLALVLFASSQASQFSRDESQEDQRTEFNLASTLTGGISSSRQRQRANLNTQLYPGLNQLGSGYEGATGSIDDAHGHEQGGSGARLASTSSVVFPGNQLPNPAQTGGHHFPTYPPPGFPAQQAPVPYPAAGGGSPGGFQGRGVGVHPQYPILAPPQQPIGRGLPGYYPETGAYPYPGIYLQQYPGYPQPAQTPTYVVVPGAVAQPGFTGVAGVPGVPRVAGAPGTFGPATSSQSFHRYPTHNAADPSHWDHRFSMNTEYKEDGVHKGPFGVLNNHNAFGYGSGYGGGYNGAFNSPAY